MNQEYSPEMREPASCPASARQLRDKLLIPEINWLDRCGPCSQRHHRAS